MAKVKVKLAGMIDSKMVNQVYEEDVSEGVKLAEVFKQIDKKAGWGRSYFKKILKLPTPPVLLLNGEQVDLDQINEVGVNDGDELALLMPMAGG
jgi:molybdopterin converting factor small subunit